MITNLLLLFGSFMLMESVAWFSHKYIMHGFLWKWHKDHHINDLKTENKRTAPLFVWEKNDRFFLIYAIPAIVLMIIGFAVEMWSLVYIASGITLYGLTYFIFHEIVYHKRLNAAILHRSAGRYIRALIRAHRGHHHPKNKKEFNSFGLLVFPMRYFKE